MIALKIVGFGCSPSTSRDYFQMSQTLARKSFDTFGDLIPIVFQDEYLRFPSKDDVRRILNLHKYEHSVLGMLGSLDVMQVPWKNVRRCYMDNLEVDLEYLLWLWRQSLTTIYTFGMFLKNINSS